MTRIAIFVFEGADELDFIGPYEALRTAARFGAELHAELVSAGEPAEITAAHGLRLRPARKYDGSADVLLVPCGGYNDGAARGVRHEMAEGALLQILVRAHEAGKVVGSVCTGAMLLAAAGLAAGRRMTTHHGAQSDLQAAGAQVVAARVVDDGTIVSAGGVTSGIDLALHLIERFAGSAYAARVRTELEYGG